jgi:quinohemoprotein ethanol dehydrogenase
MSFNPQTGLVYLPAQVNAMVYAADRRFEYLPGTWNRGVTSSHGIPTGVLPSGHLLAWDPVEQREIWRVPYDDMANGGTLSTAGNLVFQGTADGRFLAYRADDGETLWETRTGSAILAAPVTYQIDGEQYVSVMAGWGGFYGTNYEGATGPRWLLTYGLGGEGRLPAYAPPRPPPVASIEVEASADTVSEGGRIYADWCGRCHGAGARSGGLIADLRYSAPPIFEMYSDIVLGGSLVEVGMPSFEKWLDEREVEALRAYVQDRRFQIAN